MSDEKTSGVRFPRGWKLWLPAVVFIGLGVWSLAYVPGMLLDNWGTAGTVADRNKLLGSAAQIVLLGLGGVIAVIGVGLSLARHGQSLLDAKISREQEDIRRSEFTEQMTLERGRETARLQEVEVQRRTDLESGLRARFVPAVELLSAPDAVKRTAGLHALAALGDDWLAFGNTNELQVCIDVMCGYLRSAASEAERTPAEGSVRLTGYELIRDHLRVDDAGSSPQWQGRRFPLAQAPIWFTVHLDAIVLKERTVIDLTGATLTGSARLQISRIVVESRGRLQMRSAHLTDRSAVRLDFAKVGRGGALMFIVARLDGEASITVRKTTVTDGGVLSFDFVSVTDNAIVNVADSDAASDGRISAMRGRISGAGRFFFDRMRVGENGRLRLSNMRLGEDSVLRLNGVHVEGGLVAMTGARAAGRSRLRLDWGRFLSANSLDLSGVTIEDDAEITIGGAEITEEALTLPNRSVVGFPGPRLVAGARVGYESIHPPEVAVERMLGNPAEVAEDTNDLGRS